MKQAIHRLCRFAFVLTLALPASATTWIVDASNGPGTNFTDLPPAIAAAAPGDVILVRAGNYSNFNLSRGLTILGTAGATNVAGFSYTSIAPPIGETAILADLRFGQLRVTASQGVVIADSVQTQYQAIIDHSVDVRLHRFNGEVGATYSTLEIASSTVRGLTAQFNGHGDHGLTLTGSNAIVALTSCHGGWGRDEPIGGFNGPAGNGGDGLRILPATGAMSTLVLAGGGLNVIRGGGGGWGLVFNDGQDGNGLYNLGSGVWRSGCTYAGGNNTGLGGQALVYVPGAGSFDTAVAPDDPALALVGTATSGGAVQLDTYATPGSVVRLIIGRTPTRIPGPPVRVERLVSVDSVNFLGIVPAAGKVSFSMPMRFGAAPGTTFYAQAWVSDTAAGESRRTNSVPIIVR